MLVSNTFLMVKYKDTKMTSQYGFYLNALFLKFKHEEFPKTNPKKECLSCLSAYTLCAQYYDRRMLTVPAAVVRRLNTPLDIKVILI